MSIFSKKQFSNHKSSATFSLTIPKNQQSTPLTTDENDERFLSSYQNYKEKKLVSSLQDKSLKTLQIKEITNFIPENFRKRAKTAASQLKLSIETAEYTDDYYLGGKQKYQISNTPGYKAFTQKYVKTCFDKEGNLLYPDKQQTQNQISRDRLKSEEMYRMKIMNAKQDEKNFLSNIEKKIKNNNNEAFIVTIMRDLAKVELGKSTFTAEQSEKNSQLYVDENKTKFLESIKSRSINCLQEVVKNGKSIQGYISAQGEIEKNYQNMKKVLEETLKDHKKMSNIFIKQEHEIIEIQAENDNLTRKNHILANELNEVKEKMENLNENYMKLSKFEASYQLVMEKFPNNSLEKLLDKLEYLEKAGMDFTKKLGELEDEKLTIEREKQSLIQKYEQKYIEMNTREMEADKKMGGVKDQLGLKNELIQEANRYKENYFTLFKNVISLFSEWNKEIKCYFNPDLNQIAEPQATLDDPIEILTLLKKMVKISTPESLQRYLRKIIVSANQLQREFFPQFVNEKFDPDKIYDRIFKMMKKLMKENERLIVGKSVAKNLNSIVVKRGSVFGKLKSGSEVMSMKSEVQPEKIDENMFWN